MRRDAFLSILMVMVLIASGNLVLLSLGEGSETRFTPTLPANITTDTEINSAYILENTTVDPGVTLTLSAGASISGMYDSHLYVEGTLVVRGTLSEMVSFRRWSAQSSWGGITVNSTGRVMMENFTIQHVKHRSLMLGDCQSSTIKNGYINGGEYGLYITEPRGPHDIHDILIEKQSNFGLVIGGSDPSMVLRNILVNDTGVGGIGMESCGNISFANIQVTDATMYDLWMIHSKKISVLDFDIGGPNHPSMFGLVFTGEVSEISFNNGIVDQTNYGVALGTNGITNVDMWDVDFGENVNHTIFNDDPANSVDLRLFDCNLDGAKELFTLDATDPTVTIDLFNCTYDRSLMWNITGDALVNEWYDLDLFVTDGNLDPLNTNLELWRSSFLKMVDLDKADGSFLDIPVKSKWTNGSVEMDVQHDMLIRANDHPGNLISFEGWNIEGPLYLDITMDLRPFNDMPDNLDVNEDLWLEYDMKDHFTDPENQIMDFEIETGLNLEASIVGINRTLTLMNEPMDWFGTSWVNVSATDTGHNTTYANVTINVLPVNDAPRLSEPLPEIEIDEDDNWTIDLEMYVYDVEDDPIGISAGPIENCTLILSGTNLTIEPVTNWFGTLFIPVEFSDGLDPLESEIKVVVNPVNDAPLGVLQKEDTPIGTFEWNHTEYGNITVHRIILNEDTRSEFWINATDADGDFLNYTFVSTDLKNGTITNARMEITLPDNSTEMVSVPYKFIYTPNKDSTEGDLVRFLLTDGEVDIVFWISFNITPVNDPPVLTPENEGNLSIDRYQNVTIDLLEWTSDIDSDVLTFRIEPSLYLEINGTQLVIDFLGTYRGTEYNATIFAYDGTSEVSKALHFTIEGALPPPEIEINSVEVESVKDGWYINIYADEGQTIYLLVVDSEGEFQSFEVNYEGERYRLFIPDSMAEEGNRIIITNKPGGDEILPEFTKTLPALKKENEPGDYTVYIILAILLLIILVAVLFLITRRKKDDYYEE